MGGVKSQSIPSNYNFNGHQYVKLGTKWKVFINQDKGFEDIDNEIITIKFNSGVTPAQKNNFCSVYGLTYINNTILGWYDYKLNQNEILPLIQTIKDLSIINKININHYFSFFTTPNDPMCNSNNVNYQEYFNNIKHFDALPLMPTVNGEGNCNTIVAVIDNGFNYNSTELYDPANNVNQMWHNTAEDDWTNKADPTTGNGVDDDNNGYIDDWVGWDFGGTVSGVLYPPDNDPKFGTLSNSPKPHGTPIAHIIGAKANNSNKMAGIAGGWGNYDGVKIMPIKVCSDWGEAWTTATLKYSLQYARINNAKIVSMSLGTNIFDQSLEDELEAAYISNIFLVAASGNAIQKPPPNINLDISYPASSKYVFSVGGSELSDDSRWWRSCYKNKTTGLDLVAPVTSSSIDDNGNVITSTGTSISCPMVAAVAANMLCLNNCLSNKSIAEILRNSADKVIDPNLYGNSAWS